MKLNAQLRTAGRRSRSSSPLVRNAVTCTFSSFPGTDTVDRSAESHDAGRSVSSRADQRFDDDVGLRTDLARETHADSVADPIKRPPLVWTRLS
jgi:hypothetical protein